MIRSIKRLEWAALLALVAAAAFLRLYMLDEVPPGWRDDELINSLVISQAVLDGDWAFFYPDASGHEALYHVLNAGMLALFGPGVPGIRWLSALLGLVSVGLTYSVGRELFGRAAGFIAAIGLAFSFWSLMYSRVGLRHVSLLPFMLGAFLFWWKGVRRDDPTPAKGTAGLGIVSSSGGPFRVRRETFIAGLLLGLGMYTYFASRGIPVILVALAGYWLLFEREAFRRHWRDLMGAVLIAGIMSVPLLISLAQMPEMTGRVEELAVPLLEARKGNLEPILRHVSITLSMFHADGDGEWLYNIPNRPIFNPLGAALLWSGVLICLYRALPFTGADRKAESAFLLLWLGAGLAPGFVSVPPASLGHTIIAQPAAYLMPAVALVSAAEWGTRRWGRSATAAVAAVVLLFLVSNASRDLGDYFDRWPARGMVRLLYRADIREAARYLNDQGWVGDLAFGGSLAGAWDQQALQIDLRQPVADRWFDPSRALLFPVNGGNLVLTTFPELAPELAATLEQESDLLVEQGGLSFFSVRPAAGTGQALGQFANGLTLMNISPAPSGLLAEWRVDAPPFGTAKRVLVSNPPPPGVESRPRLLVFAHLIDDQGSEVAADDGLWVDPYSLRTGDRWVQLHTFAEPAEEYGVEIGLYDPVTGERVLTKGGEDRLQLSLGEP